MQKRSTRISHHNIKIQFVHSSALSHTFKFIKKALWTHNINHNNNEGEDYVINVHTFEYIKYGNEFSLFLMGKLIAKMCECNK